MSQEAVERFLGRIITDSDFRNSAVVSVENACAKVGFVLSPEEICCMKKLNYRLFRVLSAEVDDAVRRG